MTAPDFLREDERNAQRYDTPWMDGGSMVEDSGGDWVTYDDHKRILQRLAEARRLLASYIDSHADNACAIRIENGVITKVNRCLCPLCEEAAAALEGVER